MTTITLEEAIAAAEKSRITLLQLIEDVKAIPTWHDVRVMITGTHINVYDSTNKYVAGTEVAKHIKLMRNVSWATRVKELRRFINNDLQDESIYFRYLSYRNTQEYLITLKKSDFDRLVTYVNQFEEF